MGVSADLVCLVNTAAGDAAGVELDVHGTESVRLDSDLLLDVTTDGALALAAAPIDLTPQRVALRVKVDGSTIDPAKFVGGITVARALEQRLQTWQFATAIETPAGAFGSPFDHVGPALCKQRVDILGVYRMPDGSRVEVPLITGGIADSSERSAGPSGRIDSFSGACRGGRFDRKQVTLVLPPGHGLPRGRVVEELAERAGETQTRLEPGRAMLKELQVVDGDWLSVAAELEETEIRRLLWDRDGYLVNPVDGRPTGDEPIAFTFRAADMLAAQTIAVTHKADAITDVTLTGTEQLLAADGCPPVDTPTLTERFAIYTPVAPAYVQTSGGYAANPQPATVTEPILVEVILSEVRERCGVVVYERVRRWAYFNPEARRYSWNAGTNVYDRRSATVYSGDNTGGSEAAYVEPEERLQLVEDTETHHFYDYDSFRDEFLAARSNEATWPGFAWLWGTQPGDAAGDGYYLGSRSKTRSWYAIRRSERERTGSPIPPWEDGEPDSGREILGGGDATEQDETFQVTSETVVAHVAGDQGYLAETRTWQYGYAAAAVGFGLCLYGSGFESNEESETFRVVSGEGVLYQPTGESSHSEIHSTFGIDGQPLAGEVASGLSGYGPAAQKLELPEVNAAAYADGEFADLWRRARRSETRQMEVHVIAADLETCHEKGPLKTDSTWAEDEDELEAIARNLIARSVAARVRFELPANFLVTEGDIVHLVYPSIDLDHDARVARVTWQWGGPGSPITTTVEADVYGW